MLPEKFIFLVPELGERAYAPDDSPESPYLMVGTGMLAKAEMERVVPIISLYAALADTDSEYHQPALGANEMLREFLTQNGLAGKA